jgi:DMSO/TMAO reductase YedYZ heme-binding membrane subunit
MANQSNKRTYIIIGVVALIILIPTILIILGAIGGIVYSSFGAN